MKLKRYLVFAGDTHYPGGGWDDFVVSHDALDEAVTAAKATRDGRNGWWHVVDVETGEEVASCL